MLVLRRGRGQSIVIGKNANITIKVLREEHGIISIGVKAPKSVLVDRLEVYENRVKNSLSPINSIPLNNT